MTPIKIEPSIHVNKPSAYIQMDAVIFIGIDGEERCPWIEELTIENLLKLLED